MARGKRSTKARECPHCGGVLPSEVEEYFWRFVEKTDNCWIWTGPKSARGYGRAWLGGTQRSAAHRFSYELHRGPIPRGKGILHLCDTPSCVNPSHLSYGDHATNMREAAERNLMPRGTRHPNAKLDGQKVLEIRELYASGTAQPELAERFGISRAHVGKITRHERWR